MKKLVSILAVALFFSSCEKLMFEVNLESKDPLKNFEYLWNECDKKYSYFDLKNVDWNIIKGKYSAKIYDGMSDDSLFNVMAGMLSELKDGHTGLFSYFNQSKPGTYYLGQDNFDWRIIEDNYLSQGYYTSGPFLHNFIDNGEIGYIRFSKFTGSVGVHTLDFILERYKNTKGLILDLRENMGGFVADGFSILSRFVETNTLVGYLRIKSGPGHNEFSDPEPEYVTPYNGIRYTKKVAVLTDRGTYSAASLTALCTKALPKMVLIGDTTGGGHGAPNGGQLPNGWTYAFSITQALTIDKSPDYENGVPPDIYVLFDWNDLTKDEILERAILELQ